MKNQQPLLHHYTTADGVMGIISTSSIRATHYRYLNDSSELNFGLDALRDGILKPTLAGLIHGGAVNGQLNRRDVDPLATKWVSHIRKELFEQLGVYVACFASHSNEKISSNGLLSQWRGYGEDGGYCLVFKTDLLKQFFKSNSKQFEVALDCNEVVYGIEQPTPFLSQSMIQELQKYFVDKVQLLVFEGVEPKKITDLIPEEILDQLLKFIVYTKNVHFHEEREYRTFVGLSVKQATALEKFRNNKGTIVPFYEINSSEVELKDCIASIIVGPHPDQVKRAHSLQHFLFSNNCKAEVLCSEIPYC